MAERPAYLNTGGRYAPAADRYTRMEYRRCGRSGLKLPAVSLGLWHNFGEDTPHQTKRAICQAAFDHGITHFDLANNYGPRPGAAEEAFGQILRSDFAGLRDECRGDRQGFLEKFMTWFFSNPSELTITEDQFRDVIRITGQGADKALQDTIIAWATDFRDDVAKFTVPTLVIHGDDDQIVPFETCGKVAAEILPDSQLKVYVGGSHGICTTHKQQINGDLLNFIQS